MKNSTWLIYMAFLIAVFGSVVALPVWTILTWADEPTGVVVRSSLPTPTVHAGDVMILQGFVLVPQGCEIIVMRRVYDADGTIIASSADRFVPSSDNTAIAILREIAIPLTAKPGDAFIHRIMEWRCSWPQVLFPRHRELPTLRFTIGPSEASE